jgi:uncharacterized membrane protein
MDQAMDQAREIFDAIVQSFHDPQVVHSMVVHFPIVVAILGLLGVLVLTLTGGRFGSLRWSLVVLYLIGVGMAWLASEMGERAMHAFDQAKLTTEASDALAWHQWLGQYAGIGLAATAVMLAMTAVSKTGVRVLFLVLALLTSVGAAGWVAVTAHFGGEMVYARGVGVPESDNNITKIGNVEPEPVAPAPTDTKTTTPPDKTGETKPNPGAGIKNYDPRFPPEKKEGNIFDFDNAKPPPSPEGKTPAPPENKKPDEKGDN